MPRSVHLFLVSSSLARSHLSCCVLLLCCVVHLHCHLVDCFLYGSPFIHALLCLFKVSREETRRGEERRGEERRGDTCALSTDCSLFDPSLSSPCSMAVCTDVLFLHSSSCITCVCVCGQIVKNAYATLFIQCTGCDDDKTSNTSERESERERERESESEDKCLSLKGGMH